MDTCADSADVIYGASFLTMTAPDQRVAYREGGFDRGERVLSARGLRRSAAPGFSVRRGRRLHRGGALWRRRSPGELPPEDPATLLGGRRPPTPS